MLESVGFPKGLDSATFWDKGTKIPSLSQDKGTTGQAKNLAMGWAGPGQLVKIRDGTQVHSRMEHYFFSYLLTCEVYLIEVL